MVNDQWPSHNHGPSEGRGLDCGEKPIGWCVRLAKDAEQAELRAEVERLRGTVADYEHRIAWDTTCKNCATTYDLSVSQTFRAEAAERALADERARVARVESLADAERALAEKLRANGLGNAAAVHDTVATDIDRALAGPEREATDG